MPLHHSFHLLFNNLIILFSLQLVLSTAILAHLPPPTAWGRTKEGIHSPTGKRSFLYQSYATGEHSICILRFYSTDPTMKLVDLMTAAMAVETALGIAAVDPANLDTSDTGMFLRGKRSYLTLRIRHLT